MLVLKELGLAYGLKVLDLASLRDDPNPPSAMNRAVPAIEDPNTGVMLWEVRPFFFFSFRFFGFVSVLRGGGEGGVVRWSEGVVRLLCFVCFERFYMYLTYLTLPSPPSSYPRPEKKIEMFLPIYCNTWNFSLFGCQFADVLHFLLLFLLHYSPEQSWNTW